MQRPCVGSGAAVPTARPARNAETARRSASVSAEPCRNMLPVVSAVRIVSGASWPERGAVGRARIGGRILVAAGAGLLEDGGAVGRLRPGGRGEHAQRDNGGNSNR